MQVLGSTKRDPFLSPPYVECPHCGTKDGFGVLMVNARNYVRRCHECRGTEAISLPPVSRRLIYLDELALSNLAKARNAGAPTFDDEEFWAVVLERLSRLVRLQLVGCPRSNFHEEEGLVWKGYESLRAMGRLLSSELDFHDYTVIRNGQLYLHSQLWEQGRGDETPSLDADRVLDGDPSAWQPHLLIDVRLGIDEDLIEELNRARGAEDEGFSKVWATWREQDMSFDDRLQEEAESYGPVVLQLVVAHAAAIASMPAGVTHELINDTAALTWLSVKSALRQAGVPEERLAERAAEYLRSESLINVPFNHISSLLYAALARRARAGQKGVTRGMTNDIKMISTLLPYVDAMFVDRECHVLLSEHPVHERMDYGTELFSHRNKDDFIAYLDAVESSATPEHLALVEEVYGAV